MTENKKAKGKASEGQAPEKGAPKEKSLEEKRAEVSLKILNGDMWNYAAPKFIGHAEYGNLAEHSNLFYYKVIGNSPSQEIYETLFLPQLMGEGGAITNPYLQNTSARILEESLASIKVEDALKFAGYTGNIKADYAGKYVNQLDEKVAGTIVSYALQYKTDELVKDLLSLRQKEIPKGLEKLVGEEEKKENKKTK